MRALDTLQNLGRFGNPTEGLILRGSDGRLLYSRQRHRSAPSKCRAAAYSTSMEPDTCTWTVLVPLSSGGGVTEESADLPAIIIIGRGATL